MKTYTSIDAALRDMQRDMGAFQRRAEAAVPKTARVARNFVIRETVPRAFGELADAIDVHDGRPGASEVRADAPHAAAVETGSRPHMPPIDPIVRWVQLRGLQGLTAAGGVKSNRTRYGLVRDPRREPARFVARALHDRMGRVGAAAWRAGAANVSPADAMGASPEVVSIARAIANKIAREGTRPHAYMAQAVPVAEQYLDRFVREALSRWR